MVVVVTFQKLGCSRYRKVIKGEFGSSTELITKIGLTFRALRLRHSLWRRANARNVKENSFSPTCLLTLKAAYQLLRKTVLCTFQGYLSTKLRETSVIGNTIFLPSRFGDPIEIWLPLNLAFLRDCRGNDFDRRTKNYLTVSMRSHERTQANNGQLSSQVLDWYGRFFFLGINFKTWRSLRKCW